MVHYYRARNKRAQSRGGTSSPPGAVFAALRLGAGLSLAAFLVATVAAPQAAHADYTSVGGTTYIYSGATGLTGDALAFGGSDLVSGTRGGDTFYAGVHDSTTTFTYGDYQNTGSGYTFTPLSTGGPLAASGIVSNVQKVDSYSTIGGPFYWSDPVAGSSWVSAYAERSVGANTGAAVGTGTGEGSFYGEAQRIPQNNGGVELLKTFKYTTTFTLDSAYSFNNFALNGTMLTDDMVTGIWLDWGTADAQQLTFSQNGADTYTYRFESPFGGGFGSAPPLTHSLTFFVLDNGNDRTGISFAAAASIVPEPGAVATAAVMATAVLGCVVRARRRRGADGDLTGEDGGLPPMMA